MDHTAVASTKGLVFSGSCSLMHIIVVCFQYGFVSHALEMLISKRFGDEAWDEVRSVPAGSSAAILAAILLLCRQDRMEDQVM